jgi:outer membrane lipoprotein carrier protein
MIDVIGIITRTWLGLASAPLVAAPAAGSAAAQVSQSASSVSATDAVQNIQKFYAGINQVTAQFRQTVKNAVFGTEKTSDGTVWLMKPGKMRWDYLEKKKSVVQVTKSFISDGKTLYVVDHGNKQVIKKDLKQDLMPVAVTFLYGTGDLAKEFNAELDKTGTYGTKGDVVLKLTPKGPSAQYKNLYLVANPTDFHVKESIIVDSSNNVNHFRFFSPDFEKPIKAEWFEFNEKSVPSYRLIDADQQAGSAAKQQLQ